MIANLILRMSPYTEVPTPFIKDGMNEFERNTKRALDFVVAIVALIVFSPLFLICYIAVRREDGGPAIFKQERIGRFGRPFMIYKFRSMRMDAEKDGPALYQHENDTRMTKVGKFLRDHHLDELPQLWNVVKGDMAFIGPRPEREYFIEKIMDRSPLQISFSNTSWCNLLCYTLQWLHGYDGENAASTGVGSLLSGAPLLVV